MLSNVPRPPSTASDSEPRVVLRASTVLHTARHPLILVGLSAVVLALAILLVQPQHGNSTVLSGIPGIRIGEAAPNFALNDLHGRPIRLTDFRGRWVLLNFWGATCVPCKSEMPALQHAYQVLKRGG